MHGVQYVSLYFMTSFMKKQVHMAAHMVHLVHMVHIVYSLPGVPYILCPIICTVDPEIFDGD